MKFTLRLSLLFLVVATTGCPEIGTEERTITSELPENPTWTDVKPILDKYCNECHSVPATQLAPGTLRLDVCETVAGLPGAQSQAIRTVVRTIQQIPSPMPPVSYGIYPSADEQEILQRWSDQGATCDGSAAPTNVSTANANPNNVAMDMGTTVIPDMNTAVDMNPPPTPDVGPDLPPAPGWSEIAAQLIAKCSAGNCHGGGAGGLDIPSDSDAAGLAVQFDGVMASTNLPYVRAGFPGQSVLYTRLNSDDDNVRMPRPVGTPKDVQLAQDVFDWINAGADFTN